MQDEIKIKLVSIDAGLKTTCPNSDTVTLEITRQLYDGPYKIGEPRMFVRILKMKEEATL